jgi:hypothetical protein
MNQDLDSALFQDHDTNDRGLEQQITFEKSSAKSFSLVPAKSGSRIQKIRDALIDTNDENRFPIEPLKATDLDPECRKLRDSYN